MSALLGSGRVGRPYFYLHGSRQRWRTERRALVLALLLLAVSAPSAFADTSVSGQVTDMGGPVADAEVVLVAPGSTGELLRTWSNPNGTYSLAAPAGTYTLGASPPATSDDGYFTQHGVVLAGNATTTVNPSLPAVETEGVISGVATYAGGAAAAGVEVELLPVRSGPGSTVTSMSTITNASGQWTYGAMPAGTYEVRFRGVSSTETRETKAVENVALGGGEQKTLSTVLSEPIDDGVGTLSGTVIPPSGIPLASTSTIELTSGAGWTRSGADLVAENGDFSLNAPAGTYTLTISLGDVQAFDGSESDSLTTNVVISAGAESHGSYKLPPITPFAVLPGTAASNTARDLGYLNGERARWGLPAGITANADWSNACATHNTYLALNHRLEHPENQSLPGYSVGGNWAGTHSILAEGYRWTAEANPWEDAPLHLDQLMTPDLAVVGIDESRGYSCMTTWPGIGPPSFPEGTVITYPGSGTVGLPPAEDARESPFVPGKFVGLPEGTVAGRELFVYEEARLPTDCIGACPARAPDILAATLAGPEGDVPVKWVDGSSEIASYLTGAIVIPVSPLAANTTYTATVTLAANTSVDLPEVTHQWSFTTGPANPSGRWPYGSESGGGGLPTLSHVRLTRRRFRVAPHAATTGARSAFGTDIDFSLAASADLHVSVERSSPGLRSASSCVAATARLRRVGAQSCMRTHTVAVLPSAHEQAGADAFAFSGRIRGMALSAGSYSLVLSSSNSRGDSQSAALPFTVIG